MKATLLICLTLFATGCSFQYGAEIGRGRSDLSKEQIQTTVLETIQALQAQAQRQAQ